MLGKEIEPIVYSEATLFIGPYDCEYKAGDWNDKEDNKEVDFEQALQFEWAFKPLLIDERERNEDNAWENL